MTAQTKRLDLVSSNIANSGKVAKPGENVQTRKSMMSTEQKPFRKILSRAKLGLKTSHRNHLNDLNRKNTGVKFNKLQNEFEIVEEEKELLVFDPAHPYADENGYVRTPDINIVKEMVDLMSLGRTFEANATSFKVAKEMAKKSLEI